MQSERVKTIFFIMISIPCCYSVCRKSYATLCDTFRDFAQHPDKGSLTDVVIGTIDNFNEKEAVFLIKELSLDKYYSMTTLTIISSINNLKKTYEDQCICKNYPLDYVNFYDNDLAQIDQYDFPLMKLRKLSLVKNKIEAIGRNAFRSHPITEFDASDNLLEVIESDSLPAEEATKIITLKNNKISHIEPRCFGAGLKVLRLDQNKLRYFQEDALEGLDGLLELSVSYNNFKEIPDLTNLKKLKIFDISYNSIETISGKPFQEMDDLMLLDLSGNQIRTAYILEDIISPMKHSSLVISLAMNSLLYLNVSDNYLINQKLILYGNPWDCKQWSTMVTHIGRHISVCDTQLTSNGKSPYCFDFQIRNYFLNDYFKRDVINYHNVVKKSIKQVTCALNPDKNRISLEAIALEAGNNLFHRYCSNKQTIICST